IEGIDTWSPVENTGWSEETYLSDGADEGQRIGGNIIEPGDTVTLSKTIQVSTAENADGAAVSLGISFNSITDKPIVTYEYVEDTSELDLPESGAPDVSEVTQTGSSIYAGDSLRAGIFAGTAEGTISDSRQDIDLNVSASENISNDAVVEAGGVAGQVASDVSWANLYIKGNISGENGADTGLVAGAASEGVSAYIASSIVETASEESELGAVSGEVLIGAGAEPDSGWSGWKTYSYYVSAEESEDAFDLGWLVKDGTEVFSVTDPQNLDNNTVNLQVAEPVTGMDLSYRTVYRARRQVEDRQRQSYYAEGTSGNTWDLGNSGYYEAVHAYATDGYYHYVQDFAGEGGSYTTVYPYTGTAPGFTAGSSIWSVVRANDGSLNDYIRLRLSADLQGTVVIYDGDSAEQMSAVNNSVDFPFTGAEIQVTAVPTLDGKIYEEIVSETYTVEDKELLPAPGITSATYYEADGNRIESEFQEGASYEAGTTMNLEDTVAGCTYAYYISAQGPDAAGVEWENGATKDADAFDSIYGAVWEECRVSFQIPENLEGDNYLYMRVTRDNYPDTIYSFGRFTVASPAQGTPRLYYDYNEGSGTEITDRQVAEGDILVFELDGSAELIEVEYVISSSQLTGGSLYGAQWQDYSGPVAIPESGNTASCYIYARMKNEDGTVYGPITEEVYTYVGDSGIAEASPRTGTVAATGDVSGTSVASGSVVYLDASVENARILYLVSMSSSDNISLERVNGSVSGLTEDGHYFKIGNRWYYTPQDGVEVYEDDTLVLYNDTDEAVTQYVHTLVLADGAAPGDCVSYIYSVQTTDQVSAPESTLPTRYYPGGADAAVAQVEKDTYISFTSLTPGAELYYVIGNGTVSDHEDETTGTRLYNSNTGILVDAEYGSQFVVSIKAVRWNADRTRKEMKDSETVQFVFEVAEQALAQAPTATPLTTSETPATVIPGDKILLSTTTRGASIYYTTDGSAPQVTQAADGSWQASGNSTQLYDAGTGITMPEDGSGFFTVRAVAVHPNLGASPEAQFIYAFPDSVQSPYVNIPSGSVDEGTEIILRNRTEDAVIYYTVSRDGSTPEDPTISSAVFEESQPIVVQGTTIIKAFAVKDGVNSAVVTFTYHTMEQLAAPEASIASGAMVSRGTRLTLSAADGAAIYYTADGSDPLDASNSAVIAGNSLILDGSPGDQITIRAYARMEGQSASEVVTFTYQISQSVSGVTADVASGTEVSNGSKVNLMTDVTDAEIYYTTDGSSPADYGIAGTVVTVDGTAGSMFTIKAVAVVNGEAGTVATFTYRIKEKPTAPNASPSGGVLTVATRVTLSSSADNIYYTTDGTTPTQSSSLYTEPILINRTTELKAVAVSEDGEVSDVAVFQYTAAQKASAPTASQEDGALLDPGTVLVLSTETADAEIYYSTDGTEPTLDNLEEMLLFTEDGITVNRTVTIKAVAYREDLQLSDVSEYNYMVETIPAVEIKREEEERLAAEGLHDTDTSGLVRAEDYESSISRDRVLEEDVYNTVVSSGSDSIPDTAVLVTEETDYSSAALNNVKQMFGDDYTILDSYDIYLMQGGTVIQPRGEVEVGVPVPEGYENAAVTLIRIDSENVITTLDTRRSGGMIYAQTDHFSHYAVVGLEDPDSASDSFDYLLILEVISGITAILGIGYLIRQKWKKYRSTR
ncbi:MAG TPA: chitobiase/beta-hexosaminidase C-terminal domain-containing protein, partial [Candidatus Choladocola avistercoris]|nr:chitobiase/beta-hexosaminidase C-terminal domain-containing protein [Candidatus Choladocola avistercoris]